MNYITGPLDIVLQILVIGIWLLLVWSMWRRQARTGFGLAIKSIVMCLLLAFGLVMVFNIFAFAERP
jgi:hypothetical protein